MGEPFTLQNNLLVLSKWQQQYSHLLIGFTSKNGGYSHSHFDSLNLGLHVDDNANHVIMNRKKVADHLHLPLENWVCAEQIHDNKIQKVELKNKGKGTLDYEDSISEVDGLYTFEKNVLLSLCFADCVPIYFYSPKHQVVGVVHAGWKGTVKNIVGNMITIWNTKEKIDIEDILVAIGPSIGQCCYIVDDFVINQVKQCILGEENVPYEQISDGQYKLDLKMLNKLLLLKAGISPENILITSYCTSCEPSLFFSHRRDQGKTGRMMSYIALKEG